MIKEVKVSDFAEVITGGTPSTTIDEYWDGGTIPWLNSGELNKKYIYDAKNFITEAGLKSSSTRMMPPNTVLIALTGATCGLSALMKIEACANQSVTGILPSEKHSPDYLFHYLRTQRERILDKAWGNAQPHISQKFVKDMLIPLPSLADQLHIANLLSKAEALIEQRKQSIALLDEFLKSSFLEMFGTPTSNKKKFPKGTIRDIVTEVKYGTSKPAEEKGKYTYLRMNNITTDGYWDLSKLKYINMDNVEKKKCSVKRGDLLFNRTNSKELVGKTAVFNLDDEMIIAGYLIRVRFNEKANPYFIWGYLNSLHGKQALLGMCKSIVGMANINAQELQDIKIVIPPIELQTKFASIVTQTETLKEEYKSSLQELENLYGSLSQKAFKGELVTPKRYAAEVPVLSVAAEPQVAYKKPATNELNKDELLQLYFILHNITKHSNRMPEEATLAEVKMEKSCHLGEAIIEELQFNRKPLKQMFGPADFDRLFKLFDFAASNDIFYYDRDASYKKFTEGKNFMKYLGKAMASYRPFVKKVNSLLNIFLSLNTNQMDLYATVFAAWNNLLILKQSATLEAIAKEAKWHEKKNRFSDSDIKEAIEFLRTNHLEPKGKGKLVLKQSKV